MITNIGICFLPLTHALATIIHYCKVDQNMSNIHPPTKWNLNSIKPLKYLKICNKILQLKTAPCLKNLAMTTSPPLPPPTHPTHIHTHTHTFWNRQLNTPQKLFYRPVTFVFLYPQNIQSPFVIGWSALSKILWIILTLSLLLDVQITSSWVQVFCIRNSGN